MDLSCSFTRITSKKLHFLPTFLILKIIKVGSCDLHAVCVSPPINFWIAQPVFTKLGTHIMAHEPISTAYFINPSNQCVSVRVSHSRGNEYRRNNRIAGCVIFYAVRVVSRKVGDQSFPELLVAISFLNEQTTPPASCLAYSSTLKMKAIRSSEMSVDFYRTTQAYIPEDSTLHSHLCENLKPDKYCVVPTFYL
jgi:hypothetical protein